MALVSRGSMGLIAICLVLGLEPAYAQAIITTIAGNGTAAFSGDGGEAASASLSAPTALTVDAAGNVYIGDGANSRVRKVTPSGVISTVAGGGAGGDGGPAISASLGWPAGVAVDAAGNLYIAENQRIRKVAPSGLISTAAGNGTAGFSGDGAPATSASLYWPQGIAVDAAGNLYIADYYNNRVRRVNSSGIISTVAGNGTAGFSGDAGPATSAKLNQPWGVAVDAAGNLYIADGSNNRIRKVSASGIISTVAGSDTYGFSGDGGSATRASLSGPTGVAVDAAGNFYIADYGYDRIRKVDASGTIATVAGNGTLAFAGDGGPATAASLKNPRSVAVDAAGKLYIADTDNNRVRQVSPPCSYTISPVSATVAASGGSATVSVTAPSGCSWTATSNASWISITSGSGSGNGTVSYRVAANTSTTALTGSLTIAGQTFTVTQAGTACTFTLTPTSASVAAVGGNGSVSITAPSGCSWTAASNASWITIAAGGSGNGNGSVGYSVAPNAGDTTRSGTLSIAGQSFTLSQAAASGPILFSGGVVNSASFAKAPAPVAPGSIISVFGARLAATMGGASGLPLPTVINGASLLVNGVAAPLFFVSPGQINAQAPLEIAAGGSVSVQVVANGVQSNTLTVAVAADAPGVFTVSQDGTGPAVVLHAADSSAVSASNPIRPGEYLTIYCTGLGYVANPPASGSPALSDPLSVLVKTPAVAIDGIFAKVTFAGLAPGFVGLNQINVQAPSGLTANPNAALTITAAKGVSNLTRVATTFAGGGFVGVAGRTDSNGLVTLSVGSLTLPFSLRDRKTSAPLANIMVSVGVDSNDPSRATLTLLDPAGSYPAQAAILVGSGTVAPAAFFPAEAGVAIPVAMSKPASVTDAFYAAGDQLRTLLLPAPGDPNNSSSGSLANALQTALSAVVKYLPGAWTINKSEDMDTVTAAQQLSPFSQPGKVMFDLGKSSLSTLLAVGVTGESLTAALSAELPILGAEMVVEAAPGLLVRGVYDPLGYQYVRVISLGGLIPGQQIEIVLPLATAPLDTPVPVAPVRVRTQPPLPDTNVILLHLGDGPFMYQQKTGADGSATFLARPGKYKLRHAADGFDSTTTELTVPDSGIDTSVPAPSASFTLTVTKSGNGSGSVTSDGGITCGSTCSASFGKGAVVKLTATPLTGSTFTGWSGACSGTGACSVTMDANKTVTATFVTAPSGGPLVFTAPATLPAATVGVPYDYSFCVPKPAGPLSPCGPMPPTTNPTGGSPPYHFQLGSGVGFPPMGLSLSKDGPLTGTPTAAGTSTFQVCAVDLEANSVCQTVTLTVGAASAGTYVGNFTGTTTSTIGCVWTINISGTMTVSVSGSGTAADPYKGTATATGTATQTAPPGCNIPPTSLASPLGTPSLPFTASAPISGSAGTVEWQQYNQALADWSFTGGTLQGTTLSGKLTIDATPLLDKVIVINPFALTKK